MEYTEEILKKITQCGVLQYPLSKIINVLDIDDVKSFTKDFDDKNSSVYKAYKKGSDKSDFLLDTKLLSMAQGGNMSAINKFEERKAINIALSNEELQIRKLGHEE